MSRTEEPGVPELFAALKRCLKRAVPFNGAVVRSAAVKYANDLDFLSGAGAAAVGERWNPPSVKAVYASLSPLTAVAEAFQNFN